MLADRKSIMTDLFRHVLDNEVTRGFPIVDADCQGETFSTCKDLKLIRSFHSLWSSLNHGPSELVLESCDTLKLMPNLLIYEVMQVPWKRAP